ncbi:hypothetical protein EW145_g3841 [Phellinidium pouzarii]|uniref:PUB domain-containing protein n=1 Tax=Phellinidium pouzarii TaxID=167371 RepID=A0A4S4L748_9AGAM|nr:hypothetical protein EW145_g3841 [Phellinidium pouzarii]
MSSPPPAIVREDILSAAEQRAHREATIDIKQLARINELKRSFRRLIDPGIMRPNKKEDALASLKTLVALSDNLLREPDNPKYQQFKLTNNVIKKRLVDVKGAIEYAVDLGFHLKVEDLQPTYIFNNRHLEDLQIGNEILKETLDREMEKQSRAQNPKLTEREMIEITRRNVQLNFEDDRRAKLLKDKREAELRAVREATGASAPAASQVPTTDSRIPPGGVTLNGYVESGNEESTLTHTSDNVSDDEE